MTDWEKELEAADARVKAAALRLSGGYPDEAKYYVSEAKAALSAADEVMFSDEAIERAQASVEANFSVDYLVGEFDSTAVWGTPADIVAAVIAALKGDA